MRWRHVVFSSVFVACSRDAGGNVPYPTSALLDVSGESNASCTLELSGSGTDETFEIAAPVPAVADAPPSTHPPIGACNIAVDASTVNVTNAPACVRVSRTSTQLCFFQQSCLGSPSTSSRGCPVNLSLTCGGVKLYDNVPWNVCQWLG